MPCDECALFRPVLSVSPDGAQGREYERRPYGTNQIPVEASLDDSMSVAALAARRKHDQKSRADLRVGFDGTCQRFGIASSNLVIEDCEMKGITVAAGRAEEEKRLLAGRTGGMTQVPVVELLTHDLAIGVIFIHLKDAKSS